MLRSCIYNGRSILCFDLAPPVHGDRQAEVERLIALGAVPLEVGEDGAVTLADPDGNEFRVLSSR